MKIPSLNQTQRRTAFALLAVAASMPLLATRSLAQGNEARHGAGEMSEHATMRASRTGLDGYCPVCVVEARKWEKGRPDIHSTFDNVTYYFPNQAIRAKFDANPQKYVPALNGDCIVCYEKAGKRIAGSVKHAAIHRDRLYLFPGEGEKQAFLKEPAAYEASDLAANGVCVVCLAKANKHVAGSPNHTVIHDGLRYQFPTAQEANVFRQSPQTFLEKGMMASKAEMQSVSSNAVQLVGRSGCAACEFGVTPLGAPEELGLAVVDASGRVTVVENAHEDYPQIYQDRFEGKQLSLEGKIVKSQGKIDWVQPTSLRVIH
ncbi:MAG: hypothetical protein AAGD07_18485 [Planctomycetota bacterium]